MLKYAVIFLLAFAVLLCGCITIDNPNAVENPETEGTGLNLPDEESGEAPPALPDDESGDFPQMP